MRIMQTPQHAKERPTQVASLGYCLVHQYIIKSFLHLT